MNKYKLLIEGPNVNRFIYNLYKRNIFIEDIERINNKKYIIIINRENYLKLKKIKTIYKISIIRKYGFNNVKDLIIKNNILVICIILSFILLNIYSNMIFDIKIDTKDKEIKELLEKELNKYNIKKYSFKKNYKERKRIKELILNNNKDLLEWIEIEDKGSTYIVKVERRIIKEKDKSCKPRNIISKKEGILKEIKVEKGEVKKEVNDYIRKNDIVVSGIITKNDIEKNKVCSKGKIYVEVWYQVNIELPLYYEKEIITKEKKNNISITLFNKRYSLFKSYKYHNIKEKSIKNNILPIKLSFEEETKIIKEDKIYTDIEIENSIYKIGRKKLLSIVDKDSIILSEKKLKKYQKNSKIYIVVFYKVLENTTEYQYIE